MASLRRRIAAGDARSRPTSLAGSASRRFIRACSRSMPASRISNNADVLARRVDRARTRAARADRGGRRLRLRPCRDPAAAGHAGRGCLSADGRRSAPEGDARAAGCDRRHRCGSGSRRVQAGNRDRRVLRRSSRPARGSAPSTFWSRPTIRIWTRFSDRFAGFCEAAAQLRTDGRSRIHALDLSFRTLRRPAGSSRESGSPMPASWSMRCISTDRKARSANSPQFPRIGCTTGNYATARPSGRRRRKR